ncbi:DNA mismatch repair endonuclease MutL [Acetobacteraceae bacterium KSS8]|uniref:DNA mismatch repair protein MutL n=1 Tax=Endosaccharibacter trunci TaxID=2812733 RepID=A0ABT1W6A4_9PROT|nr:DNA mismatch repair endonuclease MutL [Acetobacteraceae bacterium KSS8]
MPTIRRLSEHVVNRIAAGEVIERPAAAVKELVENSIDAGARRIQVSLAAGGVARIDVSDDGVGMSPDELALAVQRHCTSKLTDETLVQVATLGFRGEALPSIGAAARLCISSRPKGGEAWRLRVEGGLVRQAEPCSGPYGTQVLVEDLFFATPARRKFLKSARVEAGHAELAVRRLALSAPEIAFRLEIDDRLVLDLPRQDRATRVSALLADEAGGAAPNGLLPVEGLRDGIGLSGFACGPAVHRATVGGQFLVVNNRPVADPVLRTAVRVAYRQVLEQGRHAVVALFLDVPPDRLDVNVHPAKTELRFADPAAVRALVIGTLGRGLAGGAGPVGASPALLSQRRSAASIWYPPEPAPMLARPAGEVLAMETRGFAEPVAPPPVELALGDAPSARVPERAPVSRIDEHQHPLGAAVAQVLDTYVIAVAGDGSLVLVDQHAAHERLTHEHLRAQFLDGTIRAQRLLIPEVVDLPVRDAARLAEHADSLSAFGIEIEPFGGRSVLLRAVPALLGNPDPAALLRDLAEELAEDELAGPDQVNGLHTRLDAVIARMACHGSIRAGRKLTGAEMDALLRDMERTPRAATCSHGRPTFLKLSRAEIERMFGRR